MGKLWIDPNGTEEWESQCTCSNRVYAICPGKYYKLLIMKVNFLYIAYIRNLYYILYIKQIWKYIIYIFIHSFITRVAKIHYIKYKISYNVYYYNS